MIFQNKRRWTDPYMEFYLKCPQANRRLYKTKLYALLIINMATMYNFCGRLLVNIKMSALFHKNVESIACMLAVFSMCEQTKQLPYRNNFKFREFFCSSISYGENWSQDIFNLLPCIHGNRFCKSTLQSVSQWVV